MYAYTKADCQVQVAYWQSDKTAPYGFIWVHMLFLAILTSGVEVRSTPLHYGDERVKMNQFRETLLSA